MSLKVWWLAFIGGLAVLVLIALSIARMYGPARPAPLRRSPGIERTVGAKGHGPYHGDAVFRFTRWPDPRAHAPRRAAR